MTLSPRRRARTWKAVLLTLALAIGHGPGGWAQVTVSAPKVAEADALAVDGPRLVADFAVAAGPETGMSLILPERLLPMEGGPPVTVTWTRTDSGAQARAGVPVALAAGTTAGFRMEADLPDLKRYAARLIVRRAGEGGANDMVSGPFVFARAPVPVPSDFLPGTLHRTATVWPWLPPTAAGADASLLLSINGRNATDRPIAVGEARWGALTRAGAGEETVAYSLAVDAVTASHTCGPVVQPGALCTLELQVPGLLPPGRYDLDVALSGAEGGVSASEITLEVRAPGWFAALVVAVGALVGAAIAHWREVDRPRALVELPLVLIADEFRRLARDAKSGEVVSRARERVDAIEAGLRNGRLGLSSAVPDPAVLATERALLGNVERVILAVEHQQPPGAVQAELVALQASLRAEPWDAAGTRAALDKLEQARKAELERVAGKSRVQPESTATAPKIEFSTGQLLPAVDADVGAFVQRITRMDLGTALFMAALIGLGGVAVLWVGNPIWGTGLDVVTAFAAGVATRLTLPSPVAKPLS